MTDETERILHFTLGPVQGFVAQVRRTRDLWSGSFLLSYLAGEAMRCVIEARGEILLPKVGNGQEISDPLLKALVTRGILTDQEHKPIQGSLPNRFKARISADFDPGKCVEAVCARWQAIAQVVWDEFLHPLVGELPVIEMQTRSIWERQINSFWDMAWVVGQEGDEDLLDRRKNWRTHIFPSESGTKCSIMHDFQELSGYERSSWLEKDRQDNFWRTLRTSKSSQLKELDLQEDERLCAIALVKRLFPRVSEKAIGWRLPEHFPSTAALAALPWVTKMIGSDPQSCRDLAQLSSRYYSEHFVSESAMVRQVLGSIPDQGLVSFAKIAGSWFFIDDLKNDRNWNSLDKEKREKMVKRLSQCSEQPSPFYAMILMDGDHLGEILQSSSTASCEVSSALACFTAKVEQIVRRSSGLVIYAGGDDVMAMTPLATALETTINLKKAYEESFTQEYHGDRQASISAGLVYAHHALPLRDVINHAHYLLDEIAKRETGRNSLAVTVLRSSGPRFSWACPWEHFLVGNTNRILRLVEDLRPEDGNESKLNSSFLYNLRTRYELLTLSEKEGEEHYFDDDFYRHLFTAEYLNSRGHLGVVVPNMTTDANLDDSTELIDRLYEICRKVTRNKLHELVLSSREWSVDGALFVRFLTEKGVER